MEKIGIVTDEGADLPSDIIEKNKIGIVSVKLDWPEVQALPGSNIYQKILEAEKRNIKSFGKTSQPSPKDFLEAYKKKLENFERIICVTLTSKLSGTYNSALQARNFLAPEQQNKVAVVDSLFVSGAEAMLVLKAIELIEKGSVSVEDIIKELEVLRDKIEFRIIFQDPKWVEAAGRMSANKASWVRRMQKIGVRPLIGFKEGILEPMGVKVGAKEMHTALFKEMNEKTKQLQKENKTIWTIINHGDNLPESQKLKEEIEREIKGAKVFYINFVNDIVGSLAGPGALALSWVEG